MDQLSRMMDWEDGCLPTDETVKLFQELIDSGLAWKLQGFYGRFAQSLINIGACRPARLIEGKLP